jgi:hypothetical protein
MNVLRLNSISSLQADELTRWENEGGAVQAAPDPAARPRRRMTERLPKTAQPGLWAVTSGDELTTTRGGSYETLHEARRKLSRHVNDGSLVP